MKKVAIATDSNSGITQAEAQTLGIRVLPMPFYINEELFFEDVTLTQEAFYCRLAEDADISTSQPSPGDVTDLWEQLLESHDQVVYIPMSSGLSASCETALMLSSDYRGRVFVVDNQRISITQRQSVLDALEMARAGMDGQAIHDVLVRERLESSIYITVDTLKYLKKGGRVTAAGAAIGTVLNIKPVLTIQGRSWMLLPRRGAGRVRKRSCWTPWSGTLPSALPVRRFILPPPTPAPMRRPRSGRESWRPGSPVMRFIWTGCP